MNRTCVLLVLLLVLGFGCHGAEDPNGGPLPPPINHYFGVKVANLSSSDLTIDIYLDDHYYPGGLVPAQGPSIFPFGTQIVGPYNYEPRRVTVDAHPVGVGGSLQFDRRQIFYYGKDYGIATNFLLVAELDPPPPPPPHLTVSGG